MSRRAALLEIVLACVLLVAGAGVLALGVSLEGVLQKLSGLTGLTIPSRLARGAQSLGALLQENMLWANVLLIGGLVAALLLFVTWRNGQSPAQLGLRNEHWARDGAIGLLLAGPAYLVTAVLSVLAGLVMAKVSGASAEHLVREKALMVQAVAALSLWSVMPVALLVGVYEELLFRGFLLGRLVVVLGSETRAVVCSTLFFGLAHFPSQGWLGLAQTSVLGFLLAALTVWRRSIWPAMLCHAGIDVIGFVLVLVAAHLFPELLQEDAAGAARP